MDFQVKCKKSLIFFMIFIANFIWAAENAQIYGVVTDGQSGDVLPGANVFIDGTSLGSSTDINGLYLIEKIPAGTYQIHVRYIGYADLDVSLSLKAGEKHEQNFKMNPAALKGEAIVVTIQARGQQAAINQQLTSESIKNIVSADQIRELPDANAAESLRRLPGVSITRSGGEGNKVVIRGLAPKYNAITIDGVRMASSNKNDRSADLSMISSTMLEGIEVSKTITADQDADMLGGAVNFKIKHAKPKRGNMFALHMLAQNGYTGLSNADNKFGNSKFTPSLEGRFFDDRFGVFLQANFEKRNLTSNEFNALYSPKNNSDTDYQTNALYIHNIPREKTRFNGALVMDYQLPEGEISFTNFLSSGITEKHDRYEINNVRLGSGSNNQHVYNLGYSKSTLNLIHNALNLQQRLGLFNMDLKVSHSYSETKNPDDWIVSFFQSPANLSSFEGKKNLDPALVNQAVLKDADKTRLNTLQTNSSFARERSLTAGLDLDFPLDFSNSVTSVIKFGGKYKTQKRSYNNEVSGTNATLTSPSARTGAQLIADHFGWTGDPNAIPLSLFTDKNYDYGKILGGRFHMYNPMDFSKVEDVIRFAKNNIDAFTATSPEAFAKNNYLSTTNDYSGREIVTAGYIMATIKIGQQLTVIPGVRYQNLKTSYSGARGQQTTFSYNFYNHTDTTVVQDNGYWLPNLNIKYKPLPWFDVRMAYSNTVSYPDFNANIPRIDATTTPFLAWNNYSLKPIRSTNYDLYFSFSENRIGLFTVGGFLKKIKNVIYPWTFSVRGRDASPYYLTGKRPNSRWTYVVSTFINNPFEVDNWGMELEWQTHLWYLPGMLSGLVLNVNYTHIFSEAKYPFQVPGVSSFTTIDTSYTDRLIYQPDDIVNLTVGYDYKDFSIRISMLYQNDVFAFASQKPQMRANTAAYTRWDLSFKQILPWYGLELYGSLNNINSSRDESVLQLYQNIPRTIEAYGMTGELGLRWQL